MSDREKLLGIAVGCLLVFFATFGVYRMVTGGIQKRKNELSSLDAKLETQKRKNADGKDDQQLVYEYRKRSLPSDPETAHIKYVLWLENQVKQAGIEQHTVDFKGIPRTRRQEEIKQLSYTVTGSANVRQITRLLYRIHSADNLHRIQQLILFEKDGDQLQMTLRIDALSMADIDKPKTPIGEVLESKLAMSLEEYEEKIAARNLFSPANLAPELSLSTQEVELGKRLNYKVKATDPEEHGLEFQLGEDAPESAEISKSGTLTWRPEELGEVEFEILVADTGIPSKEAVGKLKVRVVPEKVAEKEPEFDDSKVATVTMIYQVDEVTEMCLYVRSKDERQYLQPGDKLDVGAWSGEIVSVEPDRNVVRIRTDDGEFELRLGQALADAKPIDADKTETL